jgi:hypothetical protein
MYLTHFFLLSQHVKRFLERRHVPFYRWQRSRSTKQQEYRSLYRKLLHLLKRKSEDYISILAVNASKIYALRSTYIPILKPLVFTIKLLLFHLTLMTVTDMHFFSSVIMISYLLGRVARLTTPIQYEFIHVSGVNDNTSEYIPVIALEGGGADTDLYLHMNDIEVNEERDTERMPRGYLYSSWLLVYNGCSLV